MSPKATLISPHFRSQGGEPKGRRRWVSIWLEPAGDRRPPLATSRRDRLPDRRWNRRRRHGQGVRRARGTWLGRPKRPRMVCVQSMASTPIVRAYVSQTADIEPNPPGRTIATGLNVGAERRAYQCLANHSQERMRHRGLRDDAITETIHPAEWSDVCLVAGRSRDARRPPRTGRPWNRPSRRPRGPGEYRRRREIPSHDSPTSWAAAWRSGSFNSDPQPSSRSLVFQCRRRPFLIEMRRQSTGTKHKAHDLSSRRGQGIASIRAMV